ncbi:unnamed protein product, partial [Brachionus calyciflorus]
MWCSEQSEVRNIIGIDKEFKLYFKSSYEEGKKLNKGRKYGDIDWILNKIIGKHEVIFVSERISVLKFGQFAIVGAYLTYNENTKENRVPYSLDSCT